MGVFFYSKKGNRDMNNKDMVNHPSHYADSCSMECFEAMKIAFGEKKLIEYCKITAFKYLWRHRNKGGEEDVRKALWYLEEAIAMHPGVGMNDKQLALLVNQAMMEQCEYEKGTYDSVQGKPKKAKNK